ncbi:MAG: RIP metalloprotease RseP [Spirochaetaceae bacterium]|jgi:regulator of sigma E protease|nr:RIP metalloprotease RseP [Spirochaetaceae bacterium]
MMIIKILIGLMGLGIVVFVHELGHFLAARFAGIRVEAFSIGWGKPILKKKIGSVEYRLGAFPIGGYCKMSDENEFEKAWENHKNHLPADKGSFWAASPYRRILTAAAGPFFNIIFAIIVFAVIWKIGFEYESMDNRIVLASDITQEKSLPADMAGLQTGDRILSINNKPVQNFHDIQRMVSVNAERNMAFEIERGDKKFNVMIKPELRKDSGAGMIGIYYYAEPVIEDIIPDSSAANAGLQSGDRILKLNGKDILYSAALIPLLNNLPENSTVEYQRAGSVFETKLSPQKDTPERPGIIWQSIQYHSPHYSLFGAVKKGIEETLWTLETTIRGFRLLFRGVDLTKSLSGPARITWMAGEIATEGFGQSIGEGLRITGNFLALISIALGVTNLLPLPILDGGLIIIFIVEIIKRGPLNPKIFSVIQTAGVIIIAGLMIFAITGDVMFFVRK